MQRLEYDPLKALIRHQKGEVKLTRTQIEVDLKLLDFAYPKLKSIDHTGAVNGTQKVKIIIGGTDG